jgi:hypothetical protein
MNGHQQKTDNQSNDRQQDVPEIKCVGEQDEVVPCRVINRFSLQIVVHQRYIVFENQLREEIRQYETRRNYHDKIFKLNVSYHLIDLLAILLIDNKAD